jgi:hypothetical protein
VSTQPGWQKPQYLGEAGGPRSTRWRAARSDRDHERQLGRLGEALECDKLALHLEGRVIGFKPVPMHTGPEGGSLADDSLLDIASSLANRADRIHWILSRIAEQV